MTHAEAQRMLERARNEQKKLATATFLLRSGDDFVVRYHATNVVTIHRDGNYTLRTNGYFTATTKARINDFSSAHVAQKGFEWFLSDGTPFQDGMRVNQFGKVVLL